MHALLQLQTCTCHICQSVFTYILESISYALRVCATVSIYCSVCKYIGMHCKCITGDVLCGCVILPPMTSLLIKGEESDSYYIERQERIDSDRLACPESQFAHISKDVEQT